MEEDGWTFLTSDEHKAWWPDSSKQMIDDQSELPVRMMLVNLIYRWSKCQWRGTDTGCPILKDDLHAEADSRMRFVLDSKQMGL